MIDLTDYKETKAKTRIVMTCSIRLDKKTMLSALQSDSICINGEYFEVPERALLECLIEKRYGEIRLDLERIP